MSGLPETIEVKLLSSYEKNHLKMMKMMKTFHHKL